MAVVGKDSNKIELQPEGAHGCLRGCGVIFTIGPAIGLFSVAMDKSSNWWVAIPAGLLLLLGLFFLFRRGAGLTLDSDYQTYTRWKGFRFFLPIFTIYTDWETESLEPYDRITLEHGVRVSTDSKGNTSTTHYWASKIQKTDGDDQIYLGERYGYLDGRRAMERYAGFLGMKAVDKTLDPHVIREPDSLNKSLVQRILDAEEEVMKPDPIEDLNIHRESEAGNIRYQIADQSSKATEELKSTIQGGMIAFLFANVFFWLGCWTGIFFLVVVGGLIGLLVLFACFHFMTVRTKDDLVLTPEGLLHEWQVWWGKTGRDSLPWNELEELFINPSKYTRFGSAGVSLVGLTDKDHIAFGGGLTEKQLQWLRDDILFWVLIRETEGM